MDGLGCWASGRQAACLAGKQGVRACCAQLGSRRAGSAGAACHLQQPSNWRACPSRPPPPPCPADPYCASDRKEHFQWFYFRVSNTAHETLNVRITNAGRASYPEAWPGYNVCASYDK